MRPILRSFLFSTRSPPVTNFHLSSLNAAFGPKNESGWFLSQATLDRFGHHFLNLYLFADGQDGGGLLRLRRVHTDRGAQQEGLSCDVKHQKKLIVTYNTGLCPISLTNTNSYKLLLSGTVVDFRKGIKEHSRQSDKPSGLQVWPSDRPPH